MRATLILLVTAALHLVEPRLAVAADATSAGVDELVARLRSCEVKDAQPGWTGPRVVSLPADKEFFPEALRRKGTPTLIMFAVLVDEFGNARFSHTVDSVPSPVGADFERAGLALQRAATIEPARKDGRAVPAWLIAPVRFQVVRNGYSSALLSPQRWQEALDMARSGDADSLHLVAHLAALLRTEDSRLSPEQSDQLLARSALTNGSWAQYQVAKRLQRCDEAYVISWIDKASAAGHLEAMLWNMDRLVRRGDPADHARAGQLVRAIATAPQPFIQMWVAGIMATAPIDEMRSPPIALRLMSELMKDRDNASDPDYLEAMAAAQAVNGMYAEAVATQRKAVAAGKLRRWKVVALEKRLSSYQAKQPWRGYLCDCTGLAPGIGGPDAVASDVGVTATSSQ